MATDKNLQRFIPHRKSEIIDMLCAEGLLNSEQEPKFRFFCQTLSKIYHLEFYKKLEVLNRNYHPFNPDCDTKTSIDYSNEELKNCEEQVIEKFREILNDANYEEIGERDLQHAMEEESLFKISLQINFDEYAKVLLYWRGNTTKNVIIKKWFRKEEFEVSFFERVAMLIKFKDKENYDESALSDLNFAPGSMIVKLFRNIPKADLEMLFPNTNVKMRVADMIRLGISGLIGGIGLIIKGAPIVSALPVIWIVFRTLLTEGDPSTIDSTEMALVIAAGSAMAAVIGYAWKQWDKYKNRKIFFTKTLAENLYFKNLDNNTGVFYHLISAAEEEESKEAMLGYYFLLTAENGLSKEDLDDKIEKWLEVKYDTVIDFEVGDALRKLMELELISQETVEGKNIFKVLPLAESCERLRTLWDKAI